MKNIKIYEEFINAILESEFLKLKEEWINETIIISDPNELYSNDNYQKIISLGIDVIPILIKDMMEFRGDWSYALKEISGENPIKEGSKGDIKKIKKDWINWYESKFTKN